MKGERAGARLAATILRCAIGSILLASAVGKLLDLPGFAAVLGSYDALPGWALTPAAGAIVAAELLLAAWLFSGRRLAEAALAAGAMHVAYAGWAATALARGLVLPNCGCFGVFFPRPLTRSTVLEDLGIAGACLVLYGLARRQ